MLLGDFLRQEIPNFHDPYLQYDKANTSMLFFLFLLYVIVYTTCT